MAEVTYSEDAYDMLSACAADTSKGTRPLTEYTVFAESIRDLVRQYYEYEDRSNWDKLNNIAITIHNLCQNAPNFMFMYFCGNPAEVACIITIIAANNLQLPLFDFNMLSMDEITKIRELIATLPNADKTRFKSQILRTLGNLSIEQLPLAS